MPVHTARTGSTSLMKEDDPIAFNPFYVEDGVFDIEKKESIKTLILTLWKRDDEPPTRAEEVALSNAVNLLSGGFRRDSSIKPSFNTFYEFIRDEYQDILKEKRTREKDFDIEGFLNVLEPYYRGGEYDFLLNSDKQLDLLNKRFIVFELDNIQRQQGAASDCDHHHHGDLHLQDAQVERYPQDDSYRRVLESSIRQYEQLHPCYLFKTVRKFFGEAVVVTQEVEDIISSPIVKGTIINNSDCKILLDQRKYVNKFDEIQALLGLTDKERAQILSINHGERSRPESTRKCGSVWAVRSRRSMPRRYLLEEYICYTTEETEKLELMRLTERIGRQHRTCH